MPDKFIETDPQWGQGIIIECYNDVWSLVLGNRNENAIYKKWCYPQKRGKDHGPTDKAVPWKIPLGNNADEAIDRLRQIAKAIQAG